MGKKRCAVNNLGRSLIRDRFGSKGRKGSGNSLLHTAELDDGYDWGRLNLQSVTEENSFQEFLSTAELAGTEFQAEKLNIAYVSPLRNTGLLTEEQRKQMEQRQIKNKGLLKIPRRPNWDGSTTAEELQSREQETFLVWRRSLSCLQEEGNLLLTPYEKNINFWRQLWRVVERSDIVVQILDARNPMLFRCEDLEKYVKEVDPNKINLLLLNKADFLSEEQRCVWAKYFDSIGVRAAFFSATLASEETVSEEHSSIENEATLNCGQSDDCSSGTDMSFQSVDNNTDDDQYETVEEDIEEELANESRSPYRIDCIKRMTHCETVKLEIHPYKVKNSGTLLSRSELVRLFESLLEPVSPRHTPGVTTVGLVGYPNVGKSSTINTLLTHKKVSVSATPGKTKHFQTLYLSPELLLCDCPGLVMPSFVFTKADMVASGILAIDQLRDHVPPINLIISRIPHHILESEYGICIAKPDESDDQDRPPTAEEFLYAYAYSRGFMTQNGQPDGARAARYVLKDFVRGRLVYCHAPPHHDQASFHVFQQRDCSAPRPTPRQARATGITKVSTADLDKVFFNQSSSGVHSKGAQKMLANGRLDRLGSGSTLSLASLANDHINSKPWKNHKEKRNKREKLRVVYRHLDDV